MDNKRWIFVALLLVLGGARVGVAQPEKGKQQLKEKAPKVQDQGQPAKPQPRQERKPRSLIKSVLESIFRPLKKEASLGSRSSLCALTPGLLGKTDLIWSDRPIFSWRGKAKELQLLSYETGKVLWMRSLSDEEMNVAYDGPLLSPGQVYEWRISNGVMQRYTFEVMAAEQRSAIIADLRHSSSSIGVTNLPPEYKVAVARAEYFSERGLWSDAIQALYEINEPTHDLAVALGELSGEICGVADVDEGGREETVART